MMKLSDYDTPALVLDMEALEHNIKRMSEYFHGKKATLRAHTKIHKSPFVAHMQIEAGSKGITCAKLGEADVMIQSGIKDVLIANEITSAFKIERLVRLARYSDLKVAVDTVDNAKQISSAAKSVGSKVGVLVDVNLGATTDLDGILDRCGVPPGQEAVNLAKEVSRLDGIELRGLMGYEGSIFNYRSMKDIDSEARISLCKQALSHLIETRDLVQDAGMQVEIVSGGGTMTYDIAGEYPGVTEVQAGMYALMDATYRRFGMDFEFAVSILGRVVSRPRKSKIILDVGGTAISTDAGLPWVKNRPDLRVIEVNAEHTHIVTDQPDANLMVGDVAELLPTDVDTLTCLHDRYVGVRKGDVEMEIGIPVRGKFQ